MLISYSLKNFLSFKNEKTLDLICTNSIVKKRYVDNYISANGVDILKTAVIVGENAGGKTNLLVSLCYLKDYIFGTTDRMVTSASNTCFFFKKSEKNEKNSPIDPKRVQEFSIEALARDGLFYEYRLALDNFGIVKETLSQRKAYKNAKKKVFEATRTELKKKEKGFNLAYTLAFADKYKGLAKFFKDQSNEKKGLFLHTFSLLGVEEASVFLNWVNEDLLVSAERIPLDIYYSFKKDNQLGEMVEILKKEEFLDIFRIIDSSITRIKVDEAKPFADTMVYRKIGGKEIGIEISGESSGVKQFFALSCAVYKVIYQGKTMFADECDSFLNPILTSKLFNYIHSFETSGQFILTTHNITHLNFQCFMKEQMLLVTKDKKTLTSDLYSLCSFKDLRYDSNQKIYDFYLKGLFGGVGDEE